MIAQLRPVPRLYRGMQPVSCAGCEALQRRLRDLQAENERVRRQRDESSCAGKRQAAPFAKGHPR